MITKFSRKTIEKYLFILYGCLNFAATNLLIVGLLSMSFPVFMASGLAVLFNFIFGYLLNRNLVFNGRKWLQKRNSVYLIRYAMVGFGSWVIYILFIPSISHVLNISESMAALTLIPFLTAYSYLMQSRIVFKN